MEATVVFDADGPTAHRGDPAARRPGEVLVATGEADDHRTALDRAEEKLRRQLEKTARPAAVARLRRPRTR